MTFNFLMIYPNNSGIVSNDTEVLSLELTSEYTSFMTNTRTMNNNKTKFISLIYNLF